MNSRVYLTIFYLFLSFLSFAQDEVNEGLITAARNNDLESVKKFIQAGGNVNYTKHVGMGMNMRPLTCAAVNGNYEMIKLFSLRFCS